MGRFCLNWERACRPCSMQKGTDHHQKKKRKKEGKKKKIKLPKYVGWADQSEARRSSHRAHRAPPQVALGRVRLNGPALGMAQGAGTFPRGFQGPLWAPGRPSCPPSLDLHPKARSRLSMNFVILSRAISMRDPDRDSVIFPCCIRLGRPWNFQGNLNRLFLIPGLRLVRRDRMRPSQGSTGFPLCPPGDMRDARMLACCR